jgi:enoyl-CoA hydratase/carnithine racemase
MRNLSALVQHNLCGKSNNIARISMCSPPVNLLGIDLIISLSKAIAEAESSSNVEGIIIASNCRIFSAGLNLNELHCTSRSSLVTFWTAFQNLCFSLYGSKKAVIAEIAGHAPAAGTLLTMCADARVATPGTMHGLNESAFGLIPPIWGADMMVRLVGDRLGHRYLCQGTLLTAKDACDVGLIDSVVDTADIQNAAIIECEKWISAPGREATKALLRDPVSSKWHTERHMDMDQFMSSITSDITQNRLKEYIQSLSKKQK